MVSSDPVDTPTGTTDDTIATAPASTPTDGVVVVEEDSPGGGGGLDFSSSSSRFHPCLYREQQHTIRHYYYKGQQGHYSTYAAEIGTWWGIWSIISSSSIVS